MDNASKALIMAASILLGVMLFSVFVYVFRAGASLDETYDAAQNVRQLNLFNSYFEVYDKDDNTILDMITVANRAYSVNKDANYDETMAIKIVIEIGDKFYVIPNIEPPKFKEEERNFGRNKIFNGTADGNIDGESFSIYDLVEKSLEDLGVDKISNAGYYNKLDKLSTSLLGKTYYKDAKGNDAIRNNTTVYKYIFERSDINYKESTGRIDYMKFKAVGNTKNWELNVK
jgi:hypothetical protein